MHVAQTLVTVTPLVIVWADPPEKDASHICTLVQKVKAARKSSDLYL